MMFVLSCSLQFDSIVSRKERVYAECAKGDFIDAQLRRNSKVWGVFVDCVLYAELFMCPTGAKDGNESWIYSAFYSSCFDGAANARPDLYNTGYEGPALN